MKKLALIVTVCIMLALVAMLVFTFLPAQQVTIKGIGSLSPETAVTLSIGQEVAYASPGWLSGWAKRVKFTIDNTDIDAALSDFPILLYISASSGRNSDDISCVFDELTSDDNRKKIAVTLGEDTECYVEIEKWDDASEKAWLWVKVPDIASDADTDLYLYYDSSHADDNDAYVGDTNDEVAENVWDSDFVFVCHMRDNPDNEHVRDSTVNANDGTKKDAGEPAVTTSGKIGDAQDFAGDNDYIDISSVEDDIDTAKGTIMGWVSASTWGDSNNHFVVDFRVSGSDNIELFKTTGKAFQLKYKGGGAEKATNYDSSGWGTEWHFFGITWDVAGDEVKCYIDDALIDTFTSLNELSGSFDGGGSIGRHTWGTFFWEDFIDEIRISSVARDSSWIKASYESERDHLLDFTYWQSYNKAYSAVLDTYTGTEDTISMKGTGFETGDYIVRYYDADATQVGSDVDITVPMGGGEPADVLKSSLACNIDTGATAGLWTAEVYFSETLIAHDTFTVNQDVIPEFPTIFAAIGVAGLCFGVYYWMKRRLVGECE